jgi:hypothetical protein
MGFHHLVHIQLDAQARFRRHLHHPALNTLKAVIRRDSDQATQLVQFLSTFFRKNLKRPSEIVTLADEIEPRNILTVFLPPTCAAYSSPSRKRCRCSPVVHR